jgi:alkyl hydroperoxide reductase subunit AhpC
MSLRLGDEAPNFTAESTEGDLTLFDYLGDGWGILFSHPADFTPVCTTELGLVASLADEFRKRDTKVIGLSVDSVDSHEVWMDDIEESEGVRINFPIVADLDRTVAGLYDMIHPNEDATGTVRSVFIIGPDRKIKLILTYPQSTGRNFTELLRVLDSLQLTARYKVATPGDWSQGEDVIILPTMSDDEAKQRFPDGWDAALPYLRKVPQPNPAL